MKEQKQFIFAGFLIDGTGKPACRDMMLTILNGQIIKIEQLSDPKLCAKKYIDLSKYTLLPPLVDAHVHLSLSGITDPNKRKYQQHAPYSEIKEIISNNIKQHLSHGILAIRDGGDHHRHVAQYKNIDFEKKTYKDFFSLNVCGNAWHAKGRYGKLMGRSPSKNHGLGRP